MTRYPECKLDLGHKHDSEALHLPDWSIEEFFDSYGSYLWFIECYIPLVRLNTRIFSQLRRESSLSESCDTSWDNMIGRSSATADKVVFHLISCHVFSTKFQSVHESSNEKAPLSELQLRSMQHAELVGLGVIESLLFSAETVGCLEERTIDLLDYCYAKVWAVPCCNLDSGDKLMQHSASMASLGIIRYLIAHRSQGPLGLSTRIFSHYDMPMMMINVLHSKPWICPSTQKRWENGKWCAFDRQDEGLCSVEGGVWISLIDLVLSEEVLTGGYQLTSYRVDNLLRLRRFMKPTLIDQIPPLEKLRQFLEELNLNSCMGHNMLPTAQRTVTALSPFAIVEVNESLEQRLMKRDLRVHQLTDAETREVSGLLADAWTEQALLAEERHEELISKPQKCQVCMKVCTSRCSRCKRASYCGATCQVKDWPNHKSECH